MFVVIWPQRCAPLQFASYIRVCCHLVTAVCPRLQGNEQFASGYLLESISLISTGYHSDIDWMPMLLSIAIYCYLLLSIAIYCYLSKYLFGYLHAIYCYLLLSMKITGKVCPDIYLLSIAIYCYLLLSIAIYCYLSDIFRISIGYLSDIYQISIRYLSDIFRVSVGYLPDISGESIHA